MCRFNRRTDLTVSFAYLRSVILAKRDVPKIPIIGMAQKRMFDKAIIDTDNFMDLSMSSKALYFLLGMEADDEGFVSPKKVLRVYGGNDDDIKVLSAKGFVIPFKSGVVVITNWNENNYLDKNRIKPTKYQKEKQMLILTDNRDYVLNKRLADVKPGEDSIGEDRTEYSEATAPQSEIPLIIKSMESIDVKNKRYYGNTTQRKACEFLLQEYGLKTVIHVIENVLPLTNQRPRFEFPHISTPQQLVDNWVKVKDGIRTKKNEVEKLQNQVAF